MIVAPAQSTSRKIFLILENKTKNLIFLAVKIKTASRITFALPPQSVSPVPTNVFDPIHPTSPQMPPTTTATSIDTQTDDLSNPIRHEKQCQTGFIDIKNQSIQTDSTNTELVSIGIQCQSDRASEQHIVCRDLTVCTCVEQLVKTRQFLVDTTTKLQLPVVSNKQIINFSLILIH